MEDYNTTLPTILLSEYCIVKERRKLNADDLEKAIPICFNLNKNEKRASAACFIYTQAIDVESNNDKNTQLDFDEWRSQNGFINWRTLISYKNNLISWWSTALFNSMNESKSRKIMVIPPQSISIFLTAKYSKQREQSDRLLKSLKFEWALTELSKSEHLPCIVILHNPDLNHWNLLIREAKKEPNVTYFPGQNDPSISKWTIIDSLSTAPSQYVTDTILSLESKITGLPVRVTASKLFNQQGGWDCGWLTIASIDWILKTTLTSNLSNIVKLPKPLDAYLYEAMYCMIENKLK